MFGLQSNLWANHCHQHTSWNVKKPTGMSTFFLLLKKKNDAPSGTRKKRFGKIIDQKPYLEEDLLAFSQKKRAKWPVMKIDEMKWNSGAVAFFAHLSHNQKRLLFQWGRRESELQMVVQKIRTILKELLKETMLLAHSFSFYNLELDLFH